MASLLGTAGANRGAVPQVSLKYLAKPLIHRTHTGRNQASTPLPDTDPSHFRFKCTATQTGDAGIGHGRERPAGRNWILPPAVYGQAGALIADAARAAEGGRRGPLIRHNGPPGAMRGRRQCQPGSKSNRHTGDRQPCAARRPGYPPRATRESAGQVPSWHPVTGSRRRSGPERQAQRKSRL